MDFFSKKYGCLKKSSVMLTVKCHIGLSVVKSRRDYVADNLMRHFTINLTVVEIDRRMYFECIFIFRIKCFTLQKKTNLNEERSICRFSTIHHVYYAWFYNGNMLFVIYIRRATACSFYT